MKNVYLGQINNSYGNNAFLPYSVGLLWSYASQIPEINQSYTLADLLFLRQPIQVTLSRIDEPDILALSCYIWNWNYNLQLAQAVKQIYPNCVIILGGPEVPNRSQDFFKEHDYIDLLIHGEGEKIFAEVLIALLGNSKDLSGINGISFPGHDLVTISTKPAERLIDINHIPSPYTNGIFNPLVANYQQISFHASQETHRGCPYSCTFCDWGSAVMTKVRQFDTDRLLSELEWFGQNKIDLLYNCDANYGILKRDLDLTQAMIDTKRRYDGYPNKFRAAYAKKSNDKIFEIAVLLNDANMNKGITLSMQSMNDITLANVKRSNIKIDDFSALLEKYRKANIPTYTEVIVGLPGETYSTYVDGLDKILMAGQHDNISIYMCMLLKNSEMSDPQYIDKHRLRSIKVPLLSLHGSPSAIEIPETTDIVVETATMPYDDWLASNEIGWLLQCLHCLGLTNWIAIEFYKTYGSYLKFYQDLIKWYENTDTVLGQQITWFRQELENVFQKGLQWDLIDQQFGAVSWPLEEYSFLQIQKNWIVFYQELKPFLERYLSPTIINQLIEFQIASTHKLGDDSDIIKQFTNRLLNLDANIKEEKVKVEFCADIYFDNPEDYAREIVWYGRKSSATKRNMIIR